MVKIILLLNALISLVIATVTPLKTAREVFVNVEVVTSNDNALAVKEIYLASIICDPLDITRTTGLTSQDYIHLTKGTWWEGHEKTLNELESTYRVNAIFAMAVSSYESGYGKSSKARNRHNYYGLCTKRSWDGLHSNTMHWGNLISQKYVGTDRISITSISTKYCPPNHEKWTETVRLLMTKYYASLIKNLTSTL